MLTTCVKCKLTVSKRAIECPHCGHSLMKECKVCKSNIQDSGKNCHICGDPDPFFEYIDANELNVFLGNENIGMLCDSNFVKVELLTCPICEYRVSNRAITCPNCASKTSIPCQVCKNKISLWTEVCHYCGDPTPLEKLLIDKKIDGDCSIESLESSNIALTDYIFHPKKSYKFRKIAEILNIPLEYYINKKIASSQGPDTDLSNDQHSTAIDKQREFYKEIFTALKFKKQVSSAPNILFASYFVFTFFVLNHNEWNSIFGIYGIARSLIHNIAVTAFPLIVVLIYNYTTFESKKFEIISSTLTIIFALLTFKIYY